MTIAVNTTNTIDQFIEADGTIITAITEYPDGTVKYSDPSMFIPVKEEPRVRKANNWYQTKTCTHCEEELELHHFRRNKDAKDGYRNVCSGCLSLKKKTEGGIDYAKVNHKRWLFEAKAACPCVVCGDAPMLPETVHDAEASLRERVPLCEQHQDGSSTKARLASRQWHRLVEDRLVLANTWYGITSLLITQPTVKKNAGYNGQKWLAGVRYDEDGCSLMLDNNMATILGDCFEALAPNHLKRNLPKKLNPISNQQIRAHESLATDLIGSRDIEESQLFDEVLQGYTFATNELD